MLKTAAPAPPPPPPPQKNAAPAVATTVAAQLKTTAIKPPQQQQYTETNHNTVAAIKMERRESTTSESSLEHLDLGHTPKKLNTHSSATSTPHVVGGGANGNGNATNSTTPLNATDAPPRRHSARQQQPQPQQHQQPMLPQDSDETNDYDDDESADEKHQHISHAPHNSTRALHRHHHHHHHHKRRSSGRLDKRSVQLIDYNSENPNSLRKKFRFNRSTAAAEVTSNESGFVDGSSNSQLLNASAISIMSSAAAVAQTSSTSSHLSQSHHSPLANSATGGSQSSSASSSPHGGAGASASASASSSPESGIGERDDMKFVCPICEVVSATPHEFTNHIRCHNYSSGDTENFSCRICSKVLSSASSLDRHVLVHTGERPFNCKYCHLTFTTNGNMHRHMRTHKQHQHNHHHRRNSNGTAAAKQSSSSNNNANNNNHNAIAVAGTTQLTPVASANAATSASVNTQLTNGSNSSEGVKTAAAASLTAAAAATLGMTPTTIVTAVAAGAANGTGANARRLNGNSNNNGVESYESDGGCSTDSSSAISQQSSNNHNHNNNNNNNNNNTSSNNNNIKASNNNFKRKNSDNLDEEITLMKRRVKTTINNNNIIDVGDETQRRQFDVPARTAATDEEHTHLQQLQQQQQHLFICPVCNASEFDSMLSLSAHIDSEHCDIPAKCRHCDVVFHTHRQLNLHPCTGKMKMTPGFRDLNFTADFSSEKFPLIAKSLCEQSLRAAAVANQKFECARCSRIFPCVSAMETHVRECVEQPSRLYSSHHTVINTSSNHLRDGKTKVRSASESSAGIDDDDDDDDDEEAENELEEEERNRREEFFKHLYLKNKSGHHRSLCESPQHSMDGDGDEQLDREIKYETDCEKLAQQSHDSSKDLADIQSILNMTSSSSTSNFLKNFEQTVNTPSSNYGQDKDEEEAQDAFTSEFRKMKLRGEFPCKLCTAVFPNLRALKGHNRIHLSAAGPSGPFRCNMCPYSICDKAALVRHMRTHNGDRPYECAVCNYAFTTKANCERHLRNRHAKTTRDEVKRAIIYHPSEDSSCDDPSKKLHLFSSPDFDDDVDLHYQHQPKDRSTPVSHLKEMLTSDIGGSSNKASKIQVKSLEQLLDKSTASTSYNETYDERNQHLVESSPIDLSMDVLDLSKKPSKPAITTEEPTRSISSTSTVVSEPQTLPLQSLEVADNSKFDISVLEKNQQYLMAQQQLINDALPKIVDPAHYFQQLYRNLVFPPINPLNPFFLQNSFLPNNLGDLQKYAPLMSRMFGSPPVVSTGPQDNAQTNANTTQNQNSTLLPQISPLMSEKSSISSMSSASPVNAANQMLTKSLASPSSATLNIPRHPHMPPTVLPGGPVKMVIKNGVLMPKQKQRRYRTERPFACEHCSARFTLRSNMERHVKQQHPQFYAQRQRSGHHIMRGRGASSAVAMNSITHLQAAIAAHNNGTSNVGPASISEQVKYAILAQQLKARKDTDLLQQALAHGSSSVAPSHLLLGSAGSLPQISHDHQLNLNHMNNLNVNASMEDDEPKLVIDEDDDDIEEILDDEHEEDQFQDQEDDLNESFYEEEPQHPTVQAANNIKVETTKEKTIESAKKVAETILEQAIKSSSTTSSKSETTATAATTMKSMIAQAESVGKFLKEVASSPFKDESQDLVPVSKLVDNATTNSMSFNNYFRPSDVANHMEQSDEEGLVASGSASESNNSGTEDIATTAEPKKKSAYSLAPNRVSCPYCQRMFPWSSSLRRHILTHTGQKPFKCSHCPLLFTTKSNCDRHLLRKHGNVESAVSVYVPTEDVNEPIPVPKSVEEIEQQQRQREEEERKRKADETARLEKEQREKEQRQQHELEQQQLLKQLAAAAQFSQLTQAQATAQASSPKIDISSMQTSSELPFKCHLCDSSFGERFQCLDHIKVQHAHDFALLLSKGAIDTDPEPNHVPCTEDEEKRAGEESNNGRTGKYPDYSNRKVICAFCVRRFWSTEDLRRHMRTHSGERPFQCDICLRKFTLKHSMLRHMKKHNGRHHSGLSSSDLSNAANSGSDLSDDEREMPMPMPTANSLIAANTLTMPTQKIQELLNKANEWRQNRMAMGEQKENIAEEQHNNQTDLIGNLLGISDQGILNKLLSSADEAAKLLGVDK